MNLRVVFLPKICNPPPSPLQLHRTECGTYFLLALKVDLLTTMVKIIFSCFKQIPPRFTRILVLLKIIPRARLLFDEARDLMLN